jgi:phage shock protein A
MPGLMSRLNLIFKSKFSKALDRAENPNETLDYSYEQQLQQRACSSRPTSSTGRRARR